MERSVCVLMMCGNMGCSLENELACVCVSVNERTNIILNVSGVAISILVCDLLLMGCLHTSPHLSIY